MPFDRGSDLEKMWAHLNEEPPSLLDARPELPRALDETVRRAMAKDREDRYESAGEFAPRGARGRRGPHAGRVRGPAAPGAMRVVVAEDSVLLRAGVVHLLEAAGFDVVAQAGDAEELLREVRTHRPDVAVTDIRMPPTHTDEGLRAAPRSARSCPEPACWCSRSTPEEAYAVDLLGESAEGVGYLLKDRVADPRGFADSVRTVGQGGSALDPEVVAQMLSRPRESSPLDALSSRQRDVLARMAEGHSNCAIAEELG